MKTYQFDPDWTLPGKMEKNSLELRIMVNGLIMDARACPREIQEIAYLKGLIPYVPSPKE